MRLHHVQILCPQGREVDTRAFYTALLGLSEMPKPPALSSDGLWYRLDDARQLHVGSRRDGDEPSRSRAHFALVVPDLKPILDRLRTAGIAWTEPTPVPGWRRIQLHDPFDNHLELIELADEADWETT